MLSKEVVPKSNPDVNAATSRNWEVRQEHKYHRLALGLLETFSRIQRWLGDRTTDNTLSGIRCKLDKLRCYRNVQKPSTLKDMAELATTINTLQRSRLAYFPTERMEVSDIDNAWDALELEEERFEDWLRNKRLEIEQQHRVEKFNNKCDDCEEWSNGKEDMLRKEFCLLETKVENWELKAFESDLAAHKDRVELIIAMAQVLNTLEYPDMVNVNTRWQTIHDQWYLLDSLTQARRTALDEAEEELERVNSLRLKIARRAPGINIGLDKIREDLVDSFIFHAPEEIQGRIGAHERFKSTEMKNADIAYKGFIALCTEAAKLATVYGLLDPFCTLQVEAITAKWMDVQQLVFARDQTLHCEMLKQHDNEQFRRYFKQKVNMVGPSLGGIHLENMYQIECKLNSPVGNNNLKGLKRRNQELMEEYKILNSDCIKHWLGDETTDNTLPGKILVVKESLVATNTLQSSERVNRLAHSPMEINKRSDIANTSKCLEQVENGFDDWSLKELQRLKSTQRLAKNFKNKCDILEQWLTGKEDMLRMEDFRRCRLTDIKAMKRKHVVFESNLAARQDIAEQIPAIARELNNRLECHDIVKVNQRWEPIYDQWDLLVSLTQARRTDLDEAELKLKRMDSVQLEIVRRTPGINMWLDDSREDLEDMFIVDTTEEIQGLIDDLKRFKSTQMERADIAYKGFIALCTEAAELATEYGLPDPGSTLQGEAITAKWMYVQQLVPTREHTLHCEMLRRQQQL